MTTSRTRVPEHTREPVNRQIRRQIAHNIHYYSQHQDEIPERLRALDQEWDIERAIEANAATLGLLGVTLGTTHDRRWLALPALVTGFLLQHAVQGWCPPVPVLRRLGFRTVHEIETERHALKALRGDYKNVRNGAEAVEAAQA